MKANRMISLWMFMSPESIREKFTSIDHTLQRQQISVPSAPFLQTIQICCCIKIMAMRVTLLNCLTACNILWVKQSLQSDDNFKHTLNYLNQCWDRPQALVSLGLIWRWCQVVNSQILIHVHADIYGNYFHSSMCHMFSIASMAFQTYIILHKCHVSDVA